VTLPVTGRRTIWTMIETLLAGVAGAVLGGAVVAAVMIARQGRLSGELEATRRVAVEREAGLAAEADRLSAELEATRRLAEEQKTMLADAQAQLRETFASLSRDALKENRTDFIQNADAVLQPVREALTRVQSYLTDVDKAREGSYQSVSTQLFGLQQTQEQLRLATEGLTRSLKSPNVRGRWGEIQLRRIVELAGMLEQCDFQEKESATAEDGSRLTPDLVVRLPGNTRIVVDAKVPIDAYLAATTARSDEERQERLGLHARQVRDHIRALGAKEYWKQFQPAPEFVVMFLPLEPLLAAAFEQDGTLLDQAASLRVIPATPMTLLAVLKAVAYGWKQERLADNAEEIRLIGRELYERLATMVEHLEGVGRNIKLAADSYDRFVGSLEQKVLPGARRFKDLGVSSTKELDVPEPLTLALRKVTKPELAADRDAENAELTPLFLRDRDEVLK
jgi:DNA recombination protein RmuC